MKKRLRILQVLMILKNYLRKEIAKKKIGKASRFSVIKDGALVQRSNY